MQDRLLQGPDLARKLQGLGMAISHITSLRLAK